MALTLAEVNDRHGGELPPGETLAPDGPADTTHKGTGTRKGRPPPARPPSDRWAVFNAFADTVMGGLTRVEVAVWLALFRDTKRETGLARTGQTDLARRCGCDVRSVQSAVRSLQDKRLLVRVQRGRINAGPSVYRVTLPG